MRHRHASSCNFCDIVCSLHCSSHVPAAGLAVLQAASRPAAQTALFLNVIGTQKEGGSGAACTDSDDIPPEPSLDMGIGLDSRTLAEVAMDISASPPSIWDGTWDGSGVASSAGLGDAARGWSANGCNVVVPGDRSRRLPLDPALLSAAWPSRPLPLHIRNPLVLCYTRMLFWSSSWVGEDMLVTSWQRQTSMSSSTQDEVHNVAKAFCLLDGGSS